MVVRTKRIDVLALGRTGRSPIPPRPRAAPASGRPAAGGPGVTASPITGFEVQLYSDIAEFYPFVEGYGYDDLYAPILRVRAQPPGVTWTLADAVDRFYLYTTDGVIDQDDDGWVWLFVDTDNATQAVAYSDGAYDVVFRAHLGDAFTDFTYHLVVQPRVPFGIAITNNVVTEGETFTVIGDFAAEPNFYPVSWSLTNDFGDKFRLNGNELITGGTAINYVDAHSYDLPVRVSIDGSSYDYVQEIDVGQTMLLTFVTNNPSSADAGGSYMGYFATQPNTATVELLDSDDGAFYTDGARNVILRNSDVMPAGDYSITARATDGDRHLDQTFTITIAAYVPSYDVYMSGSQFVVADTNIGDQIAEWGAADTHQSIASVALTDDQGGVFDVQQPDLLIKGSTPAMQGTSYHITATITFADATVVTDQVFTFDAV